MGGYALVAAFSAFSALSAQAQNTSSVSGPSVDADRRQAEYRLGWVPDLDGNGDSFAHRFDYGFGLNERQSLKLFAIVSDKPQDNLRFKNINAEYLFELTPEDAPVWKSGVRFDARISDGPSPERIGVNWLNQWQIDEKVSARLQLIATRQIGSNASDAVAFESRSSLTLELEQDYSLSLLSFNELGSTDTFGPGGQPQQFGPTISGRLPNGLGWMFGNLFGLSDAAPDNDIRLWLSKRF
jgi:hypothetical protein